MDRRPESAWLVYGWPLSQGKRTPTGRHLKRLDGPQWALSEPTASISDGTASAFGLEAQAKKNRRMAVFFGWWFGKVNNCGLRTSVST